MHPLRLLGPFAKYAFRRYMREDKENESFHEKRYRTEGKLKYDQPPIHEEKNGFWPKIAELKNNWLWGIMAVGAGGVVLKKSLRYLATPSNGVMYIAQGSL